MTYNLGHMYVDFPYFSLVGDRTDVSVQKLNIPLAHYCEAGLKYETVIILVIYQSRQINRNFKTGYDPDQEDAL
jgi:hypothetical protein